MRRRSKTRWSNVDLDLDDPLWKEVFLTAVAGAATGKDLPDGHVVERAAEFANVVCDMRDAMAEKVLKD